jgi:integrase/recombinase XerD
MNCSIVTHRGSQRILLRFNYDLKKIAELKKLPGLLWSKTHRCWHLPATPDYRKQFGIKPGETAEASDASVKTTDKIRKNKRQAKVAPPEYPINRHILVKLEQELRLKAYSISTLKTYRNEMAQMLQWMGERAADDLNADGIREYLVYCAGELKLSEHTLHSRINALKFYYEQVLGREKIFFDIPRPKKPFQLPRVLNREEVAAVINAIQNKKHKTMLMLAYGCGLRVGEVTNIKIEDVDGGRRLLFIRRGKGKKDRVVSLSPALLVILREYFKKYRPAQYLFEGMKRGERYSIRSLEAIMQQAKGKAGVWRTGSVHLLRHSFATHLLDKGTDVVLIQRLLGHNDIKTTLKYLHVTHRDLQHILSPLEDIRNLLK